MNLRSLVENIGAVCNAYPTVQEFSEGDIYEYLNSGEHQYPCLFLTINNITSGENQMQTANGTIFYVDRLLSDNSNKLEVQSQAITGLKDILEKCEEAYREITIESEDYTPFTEKFSDLCAGAFVTVSIEYLADTECSDYALKQLTITKNGLYATLGYEQVLVDVAMPTVDNKTLEENDHVFSINKQVLEYEDGVNMQYKSFNNVKMIKSNSTANEFYYPSGEDLAIKLKDNQFLIGAPKGGTNPDKLVNYNGDVLQIGNDNTGSIKLKRGGIVHSFGANKFIDVKSGQVYVKLPSSSDVGMELTPSKVDLGLNDDNKIMFGTSGDYKTVSLKSNGVNVLRATTDNEFSLASTSDCKIITVDDDKIKYYDNDGCPFVEIKDQDITIYRDEIPWIHLDESDNSITEYWNYHQIKNIDKNGVVLCDARGDEYLSVDSADGDNVKLYLHYPNDRTDAIKVAGSSSNNDRVVKIYADEFEACGYNIIDELNSKATKNELAKKQDTLTTGDAITITDGVIDTTINTTQTMTATLSDGTVKTYKIYAQEV